MKPNNKPEWTFTNPEDRVMKCETCRHTHSSCADKWKKIPCNKWIVTHPPNETGQQPEEVIKTEKKLEKISIITGDKVQKTIDNFKDSMNVDLFIFELQMCITQHERMIQEGE